MTLRSQNISLRRFTGPAAYAASPFFAFYFFFYAFVAAGGTLM